MSDELYFHPALTRNPEYKQGVNGKYQCPCCLAFTNDYPNCYEICPVCWWEDDGAVKDEEYGEPNHMTLAEGRENYAKWGCCVERLISKSRKPLASELEG